MEPYATCRNGVLDTGDTAFMLFASTLVMMQTPAMGLAQAGMIRRKNSLSMLMQTLTGMCIGSLLWFFFGFSVVFGKSVGGFIGDLQNMFFIGIPLNDCLAAWPTIPAYVFVAFQMMFALMVPVIVTGAWSEKMTFPAFCLFVFLWPILVYYPLAHWVWNPEGWLFKMGVLDYAGGVTIHTSTGTAALAVSVVMQRRGETVHLTHHSLPLTIVGGAIIWAGWYSFNGGSAYAANAQAAVALVNTHLAACAGGLTWMLLRYREDGFFHLTEIMNGVLAGMAAITAASGLVEPWTSPVIGFTGGFISFFGLKFFKNYLRLDDVLDVSSLQGVPGLFGSLCVGLFACPQMQGANPELGLFYGGGMALMWKQLLAVCLSFGWSFFWTYLIMLFMKQTIGIDVSVEAEEQGLDLTQMGEQAYDEQLEPLLDLGKDVLVFKLYEASAEGRLKDIQMLLRASADPYVGDYDKRTPLHLAASGGHLAVMQYLEAHCPFLKVDALDVNGTTPMNDAFTSGSLPCIQWIKKRGGHLGDQESVERIFFNAAVEGDARTVELAAATGLSVDAVDYDGRSALMLAASEGHKPVVLVLLEEKADVHARDRWNNNALDAADLGGHEDIYMVIAKSMNIIVGSFNHNPDTNTPLLESDVLLNNQAGIERLRESKGDADHISKRKKVILTGGQRELCDAAAKGNLEELQRLIKKGGDKNLGDYDGRTPLILATVGGHIRTVSYLLDQPGITINAQDRWHNTAYKLACDQNFHEIATLLREKGAAIVNDNIGYYLCLHASKNNRAPIEKILKDGSSVNLSDYDCRTALHLAASNGHKDLVEWLLAQGANPNLQDRFGFTSLDDAKRHDHPEIVRLLSSKMNVRRVNFAASEGANQLRKRMSVMVKSSNSSPFYENDEAQSGAISPERFSLLREFSSPAGDGDRSVISNPAKSPSL